VIAILARRPSRAGLLAGIGAVRRTAVAVTAHGCRGHPGDVDAMLSAARPIHPDGWHRHGSRRRGWPAADKVRRPARTRCTTTSGWSSCVRLAAMPTWNGRDGHSGSCRSGPEDGTQLYPVRWWQFGEGW
jgi:hypothetical protein